MSTAHLMKNVGISMDLMHQMPPRFVHCLRDARLKQLEEERRMADAQPMPNSLTNGIKPTNPLLNPKNQLQMPKPEPPPFISSAAADDFMEELT
jgi:hypothetical protein